MNVEIALEGGVLKCTSPFRAMSLGAKIGAYHEKYFLSEGVRLGLSQKKTPRDSTQTYSLGCSAFWDRSKMTPYHGKQFVVRVV